MKWNEPAKVVNGKYVFCLKDKIAIWWDVIETWIVGIPLMLWILCRYGYFWTRSKLRDK